jgi:ferrous iron transport protein B
VVVDATNLDNHLRFTLQLIALGLPIVVALNMIDMAKRDGLEIDTERLSAELGVPVIPTVAVRRSGIEELRAALGLIVTGGASPIVRRPRDFRRHRHAPAARARNRDGGDCP